MRLPVALCALLLAPPALAGGYGQFSWGTSIKKVKKKLRKARLREAPDAEHVAFERQALAEVLAFERREAKRKGRKAWRAYRRSKKPKARLRAMRHWVKLYGLHARVELRFVDKKLYGAVVRVLYSDDQKTTAGRLLDLLAEKYGDPTSTATDPDGKRTRMSFDAGDGRLTVFTETATKKKRGILRLGYLATNIGSSVERYLEGIRGRLIQVGRVKERRRAADKEKRLNKEKSLLLRHL
jgi:hypothetical protein